MALRVFPRRTETLSLRAQPIYQIFRSRAARVVALLLFSVALLLRAGPIEARMREDRLWLLTRGGERAIDIEIAETDEEKALGLMFRTSLADNRGMIFHYGTPQEITMWMRNTYIPLDMLFIRADGTILRIERRAQPLSDRVIYSQGPAIAVLELAGGAAERLGVEPGDRVRHAKWFPGR